MLDFDPNPIPIPAGHFIDGKVVSGKGVIEVFRPCDGQAYAELPMADAEMVDRAVQSAKKAFTESTWASGAPRGRARVLRRWAELVEENAVELAQLEAIGSTRPISLAVNGDIPYLAETIRFYAEFADKHGGEVAATRTEQLGLMINEPYGVIGAITPWNFPLIMAAWKVAPALAAGNATVLKPSELTPFSAVRLAELAIEAGVPPGIFNVVQGDGSTTGDALVRHPEVTKITFTGSTRAGSQIMAASAMSGIKPVTLELGGKSPHLVFDDADPEIVADCVTRSIIGNAGQVCVAGTRLIIHRKLRDQVLERSVQLMADLKPGMTWHEATRYSPIVSKQQLGRVSDIVIRTVDAGAHILVGGKVMESPHDGSFYAPTILTNINFDMPAVQEEVFGPVLTSQGFEDEQEGLALASHPIYGLAAGVYTKDISKALRSVRQIEAGTVWVNRYGRTDDYIIPTGGFKQSGIGKDLGRQAYEANLRTKSVLIDISANRGLF